MSDSQLPEVWLRGPLPDVPPLLQPVAHALLQAREEVAAELGIVVADVRSARAAGDRYRSTSLDAPAREGAGASLAETLADDADDPYDKVVTLISLRAAMEDLDGRERRVVDLRFFRDLTQRQIGERIGVSQMQVSRILSSVCARLRTQIEGDPSTG